VDQEALASGVFAVTDASGIFPDGLLFDIPGADPSPPPKSLTDQFEPDQTGLDVFISVPHYRERGVNVATARQAADARYWAEYETVRDDNTGLSEKPVQVARKNIRLRTEGDPQEGYSTLRIARVTRTPAGLYQLDPRHVPPLLETSANDYLSSILRRLVEILSARSATLAHGRRQKNQTLADFTSADIANFWLLYTINSHLPVFRHLFESQSGHPEAMFSSMLSLAGALTTFSLKIHPRDLPNYDHDNLGACFTDLDEKLRLLLETVVPSNVVSLPLRLIQPSIYATALADDRYLQNTRLYLAVSAEMNTAELITKAPSLVKVCSATHIEHLIRQALPGLPLMHLSTPPSFIPIKVNYECFSLSQSGSAWEAVRRARNLAAYVPGDFPNPQLELIVVLPQAE